LISIRKQAGATGGLVAIVLVLMLIAFLAAYVLSKFTANVGDQSATVKNLNAAMDALESFVASTGRLPCPADPTLADTGNAAPTGATTNCAAGVMGRGTLPWREIGLSREGSFDSWGRKISYRVYAGNIGLTQAGGASMVNCDTNELSPAGRDGNGLCKATRDTLESEFLAGKGLRLKENDLPQRNDVAYVLISHGPTGAGAYTASGTKIMDPNPPSGDEQDNTRDDGPFRLKPWVREDSDGVAYAVGSAQYFDDVVVYRTVADLVRRANQSARNWPDDVTSSVKFDQPTLTAALGQAPTTDLGRPTVNFTYVSATAFDSGGNQNLSFDNVGTPGIGAGGDGLSSTGGEGIRLDFEENARQFAFTLDSFGYQGTFFGFPIQFERAELKFWDVNPGGTDILVNTIVKTACNADGGIASFSVDAGVAFDRVEIRPMATSVVFTPTASYFFLAEIKTCAAGVTCKTTLSAPANECS
jgi:type II secretory pathway pseudopilin PulG